MNNYFKRAKNLRYVLKEARSKFQPVSSKFIYFLDDQETYLNSGGAYKHLGGAEQLSKLPVQQWRRVLIASGEDIQELIPNRNNFDTPESVGDWYIVDDSFPPDHVFSVLISL